MKRIASVVFSTVVVFLAVSCSQSDQDRARAEAERAKDRTKAEAKRLAAKTKEAASEISDKTKSALNDSNGAAASAEAKLRRAAIITKVKSRIAADAGLSAAADVSVETSGHTVTLTGKVPTEEKRREVEKAALAVDGVTRVDNRVSVR